MLDTLLKVQEQQRYIIRKQANIIDEMFVLLCNKYAMEEIEPLLNSMKDITEHK